MSNKKDIIDKMLDAIDNETLFKGVHKVDLNDITDEDLKVTNRNIIKRRKENKWEDITNIIKEEDLKVI